MKTSRIEEEDDLAHYEYIKSSKTTKTRLDLNDLLKRLEDQKKNDKKLNLLIFSGAISVAFVVLLILNL